MIRLFLNSYFLKRQPFSLIHFITNKCNASCSHCFIDFDNPEMFKNELTLEEIERLSKKLGKSLFNINLTGGEPFLREDIFEIAQIYFRNTSIKSLFITTNGTYTSRIKSFADRFTASGIKGKVIFSISIDGIAEEHDKNRGVPGLFDKAIETYRAIEAYNNKSLIANIAITVTDTNYDRVLEVYSRLKEMGVGAVVSILMREAGKAKIKNKEAILDSYMALTRKIHEDQLAKSTKGFGSTLQGTVMNSKNIVLERLLPGVYLKRNFVVNCSAASLFGIIYANGEVHPCEMLSFKLGNLRDYDMDFLVLWKNQRSDEFRKLIRKTKCSCSFECAWSINIISNFRFIPPLLGNCIRLVSGKEMKHG
ncbi:radical SAM protein [Anaerobacterium chartisolvens]|nr:radical SAM protein [Anaerobacterium chartisolvens]